MICSVWGNSKARHIVRVGARKLNKMKVLQQKTIHLRNCKIYSIEENVGIKCEGVSGWVMQCKNVCSLNVDRRTWTWANRWTKGVNRKHHMSVVRPFSQLNSSIGDDQML